MQAVITNLANDEKDTSNTIITIEYRDDEGNVLSSEDINSPITETSEDVTKRIKSTLMVFEQKYKKQTELAVLLEKPIE